MKMSRILLIALTLHSAPLLRAAPLVQQGTWAVTVCVAILQLAVFKKTGNFLLPAAF